MGRRWRAPHGKAPPLTRQRTCSNRIPALLIFKGGREMERIIGAQPKSEILRRLQRMIS
jgi:hypothetical protein